MKVGEEMKELIKLSRELVENLLDGNKKKIR